MEAFIEFPKSFKNKKLNEKWMELKKIREICNISIEAKRANKEIGSSLEVNLSIGLNEKLFEISQNVDFAELCITSKVIIEKTNKKEVHVIAKKAEGNKCPVCWKITESECERHPI